MHINKIDGEPSQPLQFLLVYVFLDLFQVPIKAHKNMLLLSPVDEILNTVHASRSLKHEQNKVLNIGNFSKKKLPSV